MKLTDIAMMIIALLVLLPLVAFTARTIARSRKTLLLNSTTGEHETGRYPMEAEEAFTTRYLLGQKGTDDDQVKINVANTRPLGVVYDEPALGDRTNVVLLGVTPGTVKMVAGEAVDAGDKLWTLAGGKVGDTHSTGAFLVGRALHAAAQDAVVEVQHCFPVLDASGTTL